MIDFNLLDFSFWGYMLRQLRNYKYVTLPEFKKVIQRICDNIPEHVVRAACDAFDKRIRLVIKAEGQSIEQHALYPFSLVTLYTNSLTTSKLLSPKATAQPREPFCCFHNPIFGFFRRSSIHNPLHGRLLASYR
jgi:hypothetical protein